MTVSNKVQDFINLLKEQTPVGVEFVRYGNPNDGGYVVIDDFKKDDYVITLGVLDDLSFEEDIQEFVEGFDLYDDKSSYNTLDRSKSRNFVERIGINEEETNLEKVVSRIERRNRDLILKMDIEGSEWKVLQNMPEGFLSQFRQVIIEFHPMDDEWYDLDVFREINKTHQVVIAHANNCAWFRNVDGTGIARVFEIVYARRSDYKFSDEANPARSLLSPNTTLNTDIPLYFPMSAVVS